MARSSEHTEQQHPRYLRDQWEASHQPRLKVGDYVLATKYRDGDPGDHFCVGFYSHSFDHYGSTRHIVVDKNGASFRANGFRRIARIGAKRGNWIVRHLKHIEAMAYRYSVWHWHRAPWRELKELTP